MKIKYLAFVMAALLVSSSAHAEASPIAVVDVQKIMTKSLAAKNAQEQIDKKKKQFEEEIKDQEEKLQKTEKELSGQRNVLAKEAFEKKAQEFKAKVTEVQRKVNTRRQQLEGASNKAGAEIQSSVIAIITELAKEKGFSVAIPTAQTLYSEPSMDISEEVLKRLDKKLPSMKVSIGE